MIEVQKMVADYATCERERDTERLAAVVSGRAAEKAEAEVKALREELADYRAYYENAVYEGSDWALLDRIESRRSRG